MTPPSSFTMANHTHQAISFVQAESPYADSPDQLTFDEMREMPMHMALGFDTSIDD